MNSLYQLYSINTQQTCRRNPCPERINFTAQRQFPEGIAYSSTLNGFVITSLTQGKPGVVRTDGQYTGLAAPPGLVSGIGVKVADDRILVCNSDNGISSRGTQPVNDHKPCPATRF